MGWRALVILLLAMPMWLGAVVRADVDERLRVATGNAAVGAADGGSGCIGAERSGCGCGGQCAMPGCGCEAKPASPRPMKDEPATPAGRESKSTVLGLSLGDHRAVPIADMAAAAGAVRLARGPMWSYDSVQSFLCIWRS